MKTRLPAGDHGRINTLVRLETYRNVQIIAAETRATVSATVDRLLRRGIRQYLTEQQTEESKRD